jgi:hypothetical protein
MYGAFFLKYIVVAARIAVVMPKTNIRILTMFNSPADDSYNAFM